MGSRHNKAATSDYLATLSNRELVLHGGRRSATEADVCVWPPVLLGMREKTLKEAELLSFVPLKFPLRYKYKLKVDVLDCSKDPSEIRPLCVYPCNVQGYFGARWMDREWTRLVKQLRWAQQFSDAGWTLKYATVRDMVDIDPHRKLVDWIAISSGTEHDLSGAVSTSLQPASVPRKIISTESGVQISKIGMPQFPSLHLCNDKGLQARLRDIEDAEFSLQKSVEKAMDANRFASNIELSLQEGFMKRIQKYLAEGAVRETELREIFTFDGAHVARTSSERLSSLGMMMSGAGKVPENAGTLFTSRMINGGVDLELRTLQSLVEEIRQATTHEQKLSQLKEDHIESTRKLVSNQITEMMEHLVKMRAESERILEEGMLSRLKLMKCLRRTEEEVSVLTKFCSNLGTVEIAEQVYQDALKDKDQQHTLEKDNQDQKLKTANEELVMHLSELVSLTNEVASLSASLKELREAQSLSQECCMCFGELEGFSVSSGQGQSSSTKKLYKRACFLPCMHANVCTSCSQKRWDEGPRVCPLCKQKLGEKPRTIYF